MKLILILGALFDFTYSHQSDSGEVNKLEVTPFYEAIIFSDVANIMNEFENNVKGQLDGILSSASESEEDVEDLLKEYQHYLDKAHKQTVDYIEKSKTKNKVPLVRHERFFKSKPGVKHENYFYPNIYLNPSKLSQVPLNNPLDLFLPITQNMRYVTNAALNTSYPKETHQEFPSFEKRLLDLPPFIAEPKYDPINSNCYCKYGQIPCVCKCKQCLVSYDQIFPSYNHQSKIISEVQPLPYLKLSDFGINDRTRDSIDNNINIRVRVDVQIPKIQDILGKQLQNYTYDGAENSKETQNNNFSVPFPYINFPIPMDLFGRNKYPEASKHESTALHRFTIHKKKKSRQNTGNKRHRKKLITFHKLNVEQQPFTLQPYFEENYISNDYKQNTVTFNETIGSSLPHTSTQHSQTINITTVGLKTDKTADKNVTKGNESIYLLVNITNNVENATEYVNKNDNSVESDDTKVNMNILKNRASDARQKREASSDTPPMLENRNDTIINNLTTLPVTETKITSISLKSDYKLDKDLNLLYWPEMNSNLSVAESKNITTIIIERENSKGKLNMTKEAIQKDHTNTLEKAIFGEVNWEDVDTVAPVFMSFVGKYITGVLTFCSQNTCHSMKCAEKTCTHRICLPDDRWNHKGHCPGSNSTDSVATLESIMDLPSNIAFEIVDILQDRMLGKMFGKVTLCISSKCNTFIASKKHFVKSKCTSKDLNAIGHCSNVKDF